MNSTFEDFKPFITFLDNKFEVNIQHWDGTNLPDWLGEHKYISKLSIKYCPYLIDVSAIKKMKDLEYLEISDAHSIINIEFSNEMQSLKVVKIYNILDLKQINNFHLLSNIEYLFLQYLQDLDLDKQMFTNQMVSLKEINFAYLTSSSTLSNIKELPNLEKISIEHCVNNIGIDKLDFLDYRNGHLRSIKIKNIKTLTQLPEFGLSANLENISLSHLPNIKSLKIPKTIKELEVVGLTSLKKVENLEELNALEVLSLSQLDCWEARTLNFNTIRKKLKKLILGTIGNVTTYLNFNNFSELSVLQFESVPFITQIDFLTINSKKLVHLGLIDLPNLKKIKHFSKNECLETIYFTNLPEISDRLEFSKQMLNLNTISFYNLKKLKKLINFDTLFGLKEVNISRLPSLNELTFDSKMLNLEKISLTGLISLTKLKTLDLPKLQLLFLDNITLDKKWNGVGKSNFLRSLFIRKLASVDETLDLSTLSEIEMIEIKESPVLKQVVFSKKMKKLTHIDISENDNMTTLTNLTYANQLMTIRFRFLKSIIKFELPLDLSNLRKIEINDLPELQKLVLPTNSNELKDLILVNLNAKIDLSPLIKLIMEGELQNLNILMCKNIIPNMPNYTIGALKEKLALQYWVNESKE